MVDYGRTLDAENLIEDFWHASSDGTNTMWTLSNALCTALKKKGANKTRMIFEE